MGEITTLNLATTGKESLRTTVPRSIIKQFKLKAGDKPDWTFEVKNGDIAVTVRPIKETK